MKISSFRLHNYRRLYEIELVLGDQKTIMVGANNSGKTSCIGALHTFLMRPENLRMRDVSKQHWAKVSAIGKGFEAEEVLTEQLEAFNAQLTALLPRLDVVIKADAAEAYKVRDILPHLDWCGGDLGVRITYEPEDTALLAADFKKARSAVAHHGNVSLWPKNLFDFLEKGSNFKKYIKQRHFIVSLEVGSETDPSETTEEGTARENPAEEAVHTTRLQPISSGALKKLIRVDVISEQRGLGIEDGFDAKGPYSEKQRLNKLLRDYYERFLNPEDFPDAGDLEVLLKQQQMEQSFTERLGKQFAAPLKELEDMGYPGIGGNPSVEIAARISGADALTKSSSVRYRFDKSEDDSLPESYLGLGYQNLIYLTFRLLEFREKWMRAGKSAESDEELDRQIEPIHLVLVEEPEVNLHAQVQRVFIAKAYETLRNHRDLQSSTEFQTQLLVSTHSSHIVDDVDFRDLRYFRRSSANDKVKMDYTSIENMSDLFDNAQAEMKFVSKHLKLTHCDIFFADGVIFVEGQAERILVPEFISRFFKDLSKRYLSILEVSGAHTHKYKPLIEKLGVVTLVVTDLDSSGVDGKKCVPQLGQKQTTSNHTLTNWHPQKRLLDELIGLPKEACSNGNSLAPLFVSYQKTVKIDGVDVLSRTFEDALILANFDNQFFQDIEKIKAAKANFKDGKKKLEDSLFEYVQALSKGEFAFNCLFHLAEDSKRSFNPPLYISDGLDWLQSQLAPNS